MNLLNAKLGEVYLIYCEFVGGDSIMVNHSTKDIAATTVIAISKDNRFIRLGWKADDIPNVGWVRSVYDWNDNSYDYIDTVDDYAYALLVHADHNVHGLSTDLDIKSSVSYGHHCSDKRCSIGWYPDAEHDISKGPFICAGCKLWYKNDYKRLYCCR
jgi:hypothetical protein